MSDTGWDESRRARGRKKPKSMWIAYLLWLFLGVFAAHRFYLRRNGWLQLFTILLFGIGLIWVLADLFLIPGMVRQSKAGGEPVEQASNGGGLLLKVIAVAVLAFIGLGVVGYLMDPDAFDERLSAVSSSEFERRTERNEEDLASSSPGRNGSPEPADRIATPEYSRRFAEIGETVEGRRISASVLGVSITHGAGNDYIGEGAQPGALFVIVEYEYTNISDGPIGSFNSPDIRLIAPSGAEYKSDSGATGLELADRDLNENFLSDLNPMITYQSVELFEIAEDLYRQPGWVIKVELDQGAFFVRIEK